MMRLVLLGAEARGAREAREAVAKLDEVKRAAVAMRPRVVGTAMRLLAGAAVLDSNDSRRR